MFSKAMALEKLRMESIRLEASTVKQCTALPSLTIPQTLLRYTTCILSEEIIFNREFSTYQTVTMTYNDSEI